MEVINSLASTFIGHPYLATIIIVCIALIVVAIASVRMKGVINTVIEFFKSLMGDLNSVKEDVRTIRQDQLVSNEERRIQRAEIHEIKSDVKDMKSEYKDLRRDVDRLNEFNRKKYRNDIDWRD